ncbi:MAG: serine/threonine-protein kinase, partial [Planctomycetota bacterium]
MKSNHPTSRELSRFLDGTLEPDQFSLIEHHVLHCEACSLELERLAEASGPIDLLQTTEGVTSNQSSTGIDDQDDTGGNIQHLSCEPMEWITGDRIGDYRLVEFLGKGGNGIVYLAEQLQPVHRTVAIKFAYHSVSEDGIDHRLGFERDALAAVRHANFPQFYDAGLTASRVPYVVMEYCSGVPLSELLDRGAFPLEVCCDLMIIICNAVEHAHRNGVIHRDLKPSNILVTPHDSGRTLDVGKTKVIDFGIARLLDSGRPRLTETHEVLGTIAYMSPEQLMLSRPCDTRGDVYSLGVVFYQLLTGQLPHSVPGGGSSDSASNLAQRITDQRDPLLPSRALDQNVLDSSQQRDDSTRLSPNKARQLRGEIDWIVMTAIDRDADQRYQTAGEFAEDLRRFRNGDLVSAGPPSWRRVIRQWSRRHRAIVGALAVLLFVLLVAGTVITKQSLQSIRQSRELAWRTYVGELQMAENRVSRGHIRQANTILSRLKED